MKRNTSIALMLCLWIVALPAAAQEGPVAYWDFNEGKGDVLRDRTANLNDGKIHGAQWVRAGDGYALKFDGVNDYVNCGNGPTLNIAGPITVEAWIYAEALPRPEAGIAGKFFGSYLLTQTERSVWWYITDGTNNVHSAIKINQWQHIAGTFDGKNMQLYVDAKPDSVRVSKFEAANKGGNFMIGCVAGDPTASDPAYRGTTYFRGMIDDVRVYARVLSEKEIASHYNESVQQRGKELADDSWFGRFRLTPFFYFDRNELVVKVDYRGLLPMAEGSRVTVELAFAGETDALRTRVIETSPQSESAEAVFVLPDPAPRDYEVRAILKDGAGVKATEALKFRFPPPPLQLPAPEAETVAALPAPPAPISCKLEMCDGGGFKMLLQGEAYPVESTFSYPQGGENSLLASAGKGAQCEPSWTVTTRKVSPTEYEVMARGQYYAIERKIELRSGHVVVTDIIKNLTDKDVGIIVNNSFDTGKKPFPVCMLGGIEGRGKQEALHNPTAFVARRGFGLGMVAVDDVYVVHGSLYSDEEGRTGIQDNLFGLAPNASYTMAWSIYPVGSNDYFDFINVVRNDFGLNGRTVDGPLTYVNRNVPIPDRVLEGWTPKYISLGGLAHCVDDPGISIEGIEFIDFPQEMARVKKVLAEVRRKYPDAYPMFHIAHSLYATNKPERYADSRVMNKEGKQAVYPVGRDYLSEYFSNKNLDDGWHWYIFYPTMDNSFGKAMLKAVDVMMDEMGSAGVFADGLMLAYAGRYTYDRWDGHTVDIDPATRTIQRKYASVHLLSQDVILEYCRKITEKGGAVIVDSGPATLTFARNAESAAYALETGEVGSCMWLHLSPSPTALPWPAWHPKDRIYQSILQKLRLGLLWYDYYCRIGGASIFSKFFPITIEEIHSGFVKGKEKLVTCLPGVYGWAGDHDLHFVDLSDGRGVLVPHQFLTTVDASGVRTQLELAEDEIAVLKKIPVTVQAEKPVNLIVQQYDARGVRLTLNGHCDTQVAVRNGDFRVEPGATYLADAEAPKEAVADPNGTISFRIRVNGQLSVSIRRTQGR